MWTALIVEQIHQTRADITLKAGDNSHALTLAVQEMTRAAGVKFGVQWRCSPVHQHQIAPKVGELAAKQVNVQ
jgi:hypothetical protein